jgi:type IV pilus assembly protein PilV
MKRRCRGFTLIESLVALVLLSLGLLGALGMLLGSLRTQADAMRDKSATLLAIDMVERIRANPRAGRGYDTRQATPRAADCAPVSPCTAQELAAADLAHFVAVAQSLLPGVETTSIEYEPAIGPAAVDRFAITLRWRAARDDDTNVVAMTLLAPPVAG